MLLVRGRLVEDAETSHIGREPVRHGLDRDREIDQARGNGAGGHAGMPRARAIGGLRQGKPAVLLDRLDAEGAVVAGAREHDADGICVLVLGESGEEGVDRRALPAIRERAHAQAPVLHIEHGVGRRHVDVIAPDRLIVLRNQYRHAGIARQDLRQHAFPVGREVGDDDKGYAEVRRHAPEQALQRLHSSGGGADADDGKRCIHSGLP